MNKLVSIGIVVVLIGLAACTSKTPEYTLTVAVTPPGSGTVTISPPGGNYPRGTQVTLTATPTPISGYRFANWTYQDGSSSYGSNQLIVVMAANVKINAIFDDKGVYQTP